MPKRKREYTDCLTGHIIAKKGYCVSQCEDCKEFYCHCAMGHCCCREQKRKDIHHIELLWHEGYVENNYLYYLCWIPQEVLFDCFDLLWDSYFPTDQEAVVNS